MEFVIGAFIVLWAIGALAGSWTGEDKINGRW